LYLDEFKIVIKMPCAGNKRKKLNKADFKIEKFDLGRYNYLIAYE